jgi:hypothetical protein
VLGERHEDTVGAVLHLTDLETELLEVLEPLLREGDQSLATPVRAAPVSVVDLDLRVQELKNGFQITAIPGVGRPLDDLSLLGVRCEWSIAQPFACRPSRKESSRAGSKHGVLARAV